MQTVVVQGTWHPLIRDAFLSRRRKLWAGLLGALLVSSACAQPPQPHIQPMPPRPNDACKSQSEPGASPYPAELVTPLKREPPKYPWNAASRGIQGWVCLELTIKKDGSVKHPDVLASAPKGYGLEHASIEAVRRWRYQPPVEEGEPAERTGVVVMLTFKLAEQRELSTPRPIDP